LNKRLSELDRETPELSAHVKAWPGWPLTEIEQALVDAGEAEPADIDIAQFSKEAQAWLGVD
jgi:hypothetical protein